MNPCGLSKHHRVWVVLVRLCSLQITHIGMQTTHNMGYGKMQASAISDVSIVGQVAAV